jgi:hypothetical protein
MSLHGCCFYYLFCFVVCGFEILFLSHLAVMYSIGGSYFIRFLFSLLSCGR